MSKLTRNHTCQASNPKCRNLHWLWSAIAWALHLEKRGLCAICEPDARARMAAWRKQQADPRLAGF